MLFGPVHLFVCIINLLVIKQQIAKNIECLTLVYIHKPIKYYGFLLIKSTNTYVYMHYIIQHNMCYRNACTQINLRISGLI